MKSQEQNQNYFDHSHQKKQINLRKDPTLNATLLKNRRITRRMKKIISKNHPFLTRENDEKCAICLNQCGKNSATLQCSHAFCMDCISNWWVTNSTCPYCRAPFQFIYDYRGKRLLKSQIPQNLLIEREETLKCQSCWADIGEEPMRICYQCRCIYIHKRCLMKQQVKMPVWRCQQCYQNEEKQMQKNESQKQKKGGNYYRSIDMDQINLRHSQRIIYQHQRQKHK